MSSVQRASNDVRTMNLKRALAIVLGVGPVLGVGLDIFQIELAPPILEAVKIYITVRNAFINLFNLQEIFQFLLKLINLDLTIAPHWKDVVVMLIVYILIQIRDAKTWLARIWRGVVGMVSVLTGVVAIAILTSVFSLSDLAATVGGIFAGLLLFRLLHPYQIGYDIGLKSLNLNESPKGITKKWALLKEIYGTPEAKAVISKKLTAAWRLTIWVIAFYLIYGLWSYLNQGSVRADVEYFFFLIFLAFLSLFQVFLEPMPDPPKKGFGFSLVAENAIKKAWYFSTSSGNYRIGSNLGYVTFLAFSLAYPTTSLYANILEYFAG